MLDLIQFMLILDVTVVNVALPRIQHDLGFSRGSHVPAWPGVVNGCVIMAGGLLLLGGRLAGIFGRRRLFLLGVDVFALASATCAAAFAPAILVSSRFVQGLGEALAAPASLGLIALLFPDNHERMKALVIWGGLSGLAGVSGVVLSGAVTDLASWRWIFFINVSIALVVLLPVPRLVSVSRMVREDHRLDFAGGGHRDRRAGGDRPRPAAGRLAPMGVHPWRSTHGGPGRCCYPLLGGVGVLAAMVVVEARSPAGATRTASQAIVTVLIPVAVLRQPHPRGCQHRPVLCRRVLLVLLPTDPVPRRGAARDDRAGRVLRLVVPAGANAALQQVTGQDSSLASGV